MAIKDFKIIDENYIIENINKLTLKEIGTHLGVSPNTVRNRVEKLGLEYHLRPCQKWTKEEEKILKKMAPKYNAKEIANRLNRTEYAVLRKINKLKLNYINTNKKWTREETKFIRENWEKMSIAGIARELKVSRSMVITKAKKMRLKKKDNKSRIKWTKEKIEELKELINTNTITELAEYYDTTEQAIRNLLKREHIHRVSNKFTWNEKNIELLRKYAKVMTLAEVANKMNRPIGTVREMAKTLNIKFVPNKKYEDNRWIKKKDDETLIRLVNEGRTKIEIAIIMNKKDSAILKHATRLGLKLKRSGIKKWDGDEEARFINLARIKTLEELSRIFIRTQSSLRHKANQLGITLIVDKKFWTKEDKELLIELAINKKIPIKEIAKRLDRTEDAITLMINLLGYNIQTSDRRRWTKEEEEILRKVWGKKRIELICKQLNRTEKSIKCKVHELGLGSQIENNYDGMTIPLLASLFKISEEVISINWISLGLKYKVRRMGKNSSYKYITINELMKFLEKNQNIWDSRNLEQNILGIEPDWLIEKRRIDRNKSKKEYNKNKIMKQKLIQNNIIPIDYYQGKNKQKKIGVRL